MTGFTIDKNTCIFNALIDLYVLFGDV